MQCQSSPSHGHLVGKGLAADIVTVDYESPKKDILERRSCYQGLATFLYSTEAFGARMIEQSRVIMRRLRHQKAARAS